MNPGSSGIRLKTFVVVCVFFLATLSGTERSFSQVFGTSNHTVTVTVAQINNIQVTVGNINLTITGSNAVAGQDQMSQSDQTSSLLWGINRSSQKITVQSNLASQKFALTVEALAPTQGTTGGAVTVTTSAADFLTNIGRSAGSCSIKYTAVALASQGIGSDAHSITFTIQSQ